MNTIKGLLAGEYVGAKEITLSEGLNQFPVELFSLVESLEKLDLSGNNISELPDDISQFKLLKIIFLSKNKFKEFPKQLANCPSLTMVGFKSNKIQFIPEDSFPKKLQWLILTDNKISKLPQSIGSCEFLQKCALAGNQISELPEQMKQCKRLELLRIAANQLQEIPEWLLELPRLTWLAFSGNPCAPKIEKPTVTSFDWNQITVRQQLGQGASGDIYNALIDNNEEFAIKIFKGAITSDGYAEDEQLTWMHVGNHEHIVSIIGEIVHHPEGKQGIVMHLIDKSFQTLANPPSLLSCSRDLYDKEIIFTPSQSFQLLSGILDASIFLHSKFVMHGDLYAHNILYDIYGTSFLGDFGAATYYNSSKLNATKMERLDVRAFGCLMEEVVERTVNLSNDEKWKEIIQLCLDEELIKRPSFIELKGIFSFILD
jgi:hypothetical protein